MKGKVLGMLIVLVMMVFTGTQIVFAAPDDGDGPQAGDQKAKRTILLYCCGSDLESEGGMAKHNLEQILKSKFSSDGDINFIILTGGCNFWQLDNDEDPENDNKYLVFPDGVDVPEDAVIKEDPNDPDHFLPVNNNKGRISGVYDQIWEARGADSAENAGKLVLRDGDGITGPAGTAVKGEYELMSDPATLQAFIDYGVANYPAEKYDLIFWDHGGGPQDGFGYDEHYSKKTAPAGIRDYMTFAGIVDALGDNDVVDSNGDGERDARFDFVDFDACLMGNLELSLVLSDYTDYYIASADLEPGYGQCYGPYQEGKYKGWLDELGDPAMDAIYNGSEGTFELGKVIVDDYYTFYSDEKSPGAGTSATLAVFDTQKMVGNETFMDALSRLIAQLRTEAETGEALQIYDEMRSIGKTIDFSDNQLIDLAGLAAFLGVADTEKDESIADRTNAYSGLADTFNGLFPHREESMNIVENDFMYAKCTLDEQSEEGNYYKKGETAGLWDDVAYGSLFSTGLSIFFPDGMKGSTPADYLDAIDPVLLKMPENDKRRELLTEYETVVADYAIIRITGDAVGTILNEESAFYPEENTAFGDRSKVDHDLVMNYWKDESTAIWDDEVSHYVEKISIDGGYLPWLTKLIDQMAGDALIAEDIDVTEVEYDDSEGYQIDVREGNNSILKSVDLSVNAELPVLQEYIESLTGNDEKIMKRLGKLSIGSFQGYNNKGSTWILPELEAKWYGVNDANGDYHVAAIAYESNSIFSVPVRVRNSEDGGDTDRLVYLEFAKEENTESYGLKSLYFPKGSGGVMRLDPKKLTGDLTVLPIIYVDASSTKKKYFAPISREPFVINSGNAGSITLDYTDVDNISDIEDVNGDGKKLDKTLSLSDFYGYKLDISHRVIKRQKHISQAEIKPAVYTGEELAPVVTCKGTTLKEGVDYTWEKVNDVTGEGEDEQFITPEFKNARTYEVILTGTGEYTGIIKKEFTITKAANPLSVKGKTVKVSKKKLQKKTQKLAVTKVLKFRKKGQGKTTYIKKSGNKKITINKKTGKLTVKKGLKKGTYKVKVQIKAAGNGNYKPSGVKNVRVTVKVR